MLRLWCILSIFQLAACAVKSKVASPSVVATANWNSVDHSFPSFPDVDPSFPKGFERIPFSESCNEVVLGQEEAGLNEGETRRAFEVAKDLMRRFTASPFPVRDVNEAVSSGLPIVDRLDAPLGLRLGPARGEMTYPNFVDFDVSVGPSKRRCRRKNTREVIDFAWIPVEWTVVGPEAEKKWPQNGSYIFNFGLRLDRTPDSVFFFGVIASAF